VADGAAALKLQLSAADETQDGARPPQAGVTELAHPPSVFFQKAVPLRLRSRYQPPDARKLSGTLLGKRLERRRDCGCAKRNEQRAAVYHGINPSLG
jgi:hypothetical protein